jgi:hypothetical protein
LAGREKSTEGVGEMSRRASRIGASTLASLLATGVIWGTTAGAETAKVNAKLLASEKRLPRGVFHSIGRLAVTRQAYERLWERFRLRTDRPPVSFKRRAVLFAGTGESGSCPMHYRRLMLNEDSTTFRIALKDTGYEVCTDDWTPRSMVISLPRAEVPRRRLHVRFDRNGERFEVTRVRE